MFREQLKLLRNQKHLSQAQLAKEIGVSSSTIAMWESGEREPKNYETLEIIADFFNVNAVDTLLGVQAGANIAADAASVVAEGEKIFGAVRTESK